MVDLDDIDARLRALKENIHHGGLTVLDRAIQTAKFVELFSRKAGTEKMLTKLGLADRPLRDNSRARGSPSRPTMVARGQNVERGRRHPRG